MQSAHSRWTAAVLRMRLAPSCLDACVCSLHQLVPCWGCTDAQTLVAALLSAGRMDQACAYGSVPVLMTFDRDLLRVDRIKLAGKGDAARVLE